MRASLIASFSQPACQAMKEWKEKLESIKKSKARASGSSVMSSSTSEPAQPVSEGIDLNREASDPLSVVRTPSASSKELVSKHRPLSDSSDEVLCHNRTGSRRKHSVLSLLDSVELEPKRKVRDIRVGEAPDIFYVDRIVEETTNKGITMYKVRWMGYSASEDTWEPASNISARVSDPLLLSHSFVFSFLINNQFLQVLSEWSQFHRSSS